MDAQTITRRTFMSNSARAAGLTLAARSIVLEAKPIPASPQSLPPSDTVRFDMIEAERKNRRIVQIGSQRRSSILYAKAKDLYDQGAIGEVCLVEGTMGRNDPCGAWQYTVPPDLSPQTVDWETWLGAAPKCP